MSKKTNRRIDHKRIRRAERQALDGERPRLIRSWSGWGPKLEQPLTDIQMPHRKKRQHKRKPKDRCPVNGRHQFLKDTEISKEVGLRWSYKEHDWRVYTYTVEREFKLCVHCGKDVTIKRQRNY